MQVPSRTVNFNQVLALKTQIVIVMQTSFSWSALSLIFLYSRSADLILLWPVLLSVEESLTRALYTIR